MKCPWNQAKCGDTSECRPLSVFCNGHRDCQNGADEWDFCSNISQCNIQCEYKCGLTLQGPKCYCPDGHRPEGNRCVDANECEIDGSCAQTCKNTIGSFTCWCASGYVQNGTDCIAKNGNYFLYSMYLCSIG